MSFIEARLLECVAYGTQGGPTWSTRRVTLKSDIERRNPRRSRPMYRYQVIYRNLIEGDHHEVINAFNACMGGAFGFRIKDWADFTADDQLLGLGTGAEQVVQLVKLYTFGTQTVSRPIRKPVAGTVELTANGVPIAATVDTTTGLVTYTAANASVVRWSGEFDVPVCFEDDELSFAVENKNNEVGFLLTADVGLKEDLAA